MRKFECVHKDVAHLILQDARAQDVELSAHGLILVVCVVASVCFDPDALLSAYLLVLAHPVVVHERQRGGCGHCGGESGREVLDEDWPRPTIRLELLVS